MTRVLVTGGTGILGRPVVSRLIGMGYTVRVMSHRQPRPGEDAHVEWAQADLADGTGLAEVVAGVDSIVHLASKPKLIGRHTDRDELGNIDVRGTRRLLEQARAAGVGHCLYISIVGVGEVPMPYYRQKLAVERLVQGSGIPWTIARATQFHPFIAMFVRLLAYFPAFMLDTSLRFQPVATSEAADYLCRWVAAGPSGRVADFGGPQTLTAGELARTWLAEYGKRRLIIPIHLPGKLAAAIRAGGLTRLQGEHGKITWVEWLHEQVAQAKARQPIETYPIRRPK